MASRSHRSVCLGTLLLVSSVGISAALESSNPASAPTCADWVEMQEAVNRTIQIPDVPLQDRFKLNFQVTQNYNRLSALVRAFVPVHTPSWPTLAQFASHSVGLSIRGMGVDEYVEWLIEEGYVTSWWVRLFRMGGPATRKLQPVAIESISRALYRGNRHIMHVIGTAYTEYGKTFCNLVDAPSSEREEALKQLIQRLDHLFPPVEGRPLGLGVTALYRAHFHGGTTKERTELMYLHSLYFGWDEQARLQPHLEDAMRLHIWLPGMGEDDTFVIEAPELVTLLVQFIMPGYRLIASRDIPRRHWDGEEFAPLLRGRFDMPLLNDLWAEWAGTNHTSRGSASTDWTDLKQRLRFVFSLFRAFFDYDDIMRCSPYTKSQDAMIQKGFNPRENEICVLQCCSELDSNGVDSSGRPAKRRGGLLDLPMGDDEGLGVQFAGWLSDVMG